MSRRTGVAMVFPLLHLDAKADRGLERDGYGLAFLAELRVTEDHFVRTDRHRQVADGSFPDAAAVDPDLRPRGRVDVEDAERQLEREGRHFSGRHLDRA